MKVGPFELNDAKVAEAKARFEANAPRRKYRTTFGEYLELFASDCKEFVQIAKSLSKDGEGPSKWAVGSNFHRYFEKLFPGRQGFRKRRKLCAIKKRRLCGIRKKKLSMATVEINRDMLLHKVILVAKANGLDCCIIKKKRNPVVEVEGKRCKILFVASPWRANSRSNRLLTHQCISSVTLDKFDFLIIFQNVGGIQRFFVIPSQDLQVYSGEIKSLYIPLDKLPTYRNINSKINWWQYENAWYLLKSVPSTVAPSITTQIGEPVPASAS